jgi:hypothetical protein
VISPVYVNPVPALDPASIYQGWQNRSALPAGSNEYAVISVFQSTRRGTNVEILINTGAADDEPETYQARAYFETRVQVDLVSDSDLGRQRALCLEVAAWSTIGVNFFKPYSITCQFGDPVQEIPQIDEANQFVRRYMTSLRLAYWAGVDVGSAWIEVRADGTGILLNPVEGITSHPSQE